MSTTTEIRPGATVRVIAAYQGITVGSTCRVHREADHNGNVIIDHPIRGRMQYPGDSLEVVAPPSALPAEQPNPVSQLMNRHIERLKITTSGQLAERRADDTRHAAVMSAGDAPVDAITAPVSDENPKNDLEDVLARESETAESRPKRVVSATHGAAVSAGKARAKAERAALAALVDQAPATIGEMTELARDTVSKHLRSALWKLTEGAPASDLVAVSRLIEQHEAQP